MKTIDNKKKLEEYLLLHDDDEEYDAHKNEYNKLIKSKENDKKEYYHALRNRNVSREQ